jgi:long-chain fatty acid transport protein
MITRYFKFTPVAALCAAALPAIATNGMNMEGYGPVSTGMGGAAQAMDHGTAAMAQNPATLGLMGQGARFDAALRRAGSQGGQQHGRHAHGRIQRHLYVMPAFGYVRRSGSLVYGLGLFAQGGMGTDYGADSFLAMGSGAGRAL